MSGLSLGRAPQCGAIISIASFLYSSARRGKVVCVVLACVMTTHLKADGVTDFPGAQQDAGVADVEAQVMSVPGRGQVIVNAGFKDGVREGQLLPVSRAGKDLGLVEVAEVFNDRSRCVSEKELKTGDDVGLVTELEIAGECVDDTGKLLTGVSVGLFRYKFNAVDDSPLIAETVSDSEGRFQFPKIAAVQYSFYRSDVIVVAKKSGHVSYAKRLDAVDARDLRIDLSTQTGTLVGIVLDPNSQPVVGARVGMPGDARSVNGIHNVLTDGKGKFLLADVPKWNPDPNRNEQRPLIVEHEAAARTVARYERIPSVVNIKLAEPAVIRGRVIDDVSGQAVPNALVSAQGVADSGWYQVRADDQGDYELKMMADKYNIWSESVERIPIAADSAEAVPGKTKENVDIHLVRGAIVQGTYQNTDGEAITTAAGSRVAHYGPARPRSGAAVTSSVIAPDGSFRLRVAPGQNYIYLMSAGLSASATVDVADGQLLTLDLIEGARARQPARAAVRLIPAVKIEPAKPVRDRGNTPVGRLLDRLETQNAGAQRFTDEWLLTLKQLVDLGEEAVPELCAELDATDNDLMLRCMGFTLRAIGDARAVPSLIRAIPKTLRPPGSDMGVIAADQQLRTFAQANDLQPQNDPDGMYGFARPVREIMRALHKLTGQDFGDEEFFHIFLQGRASQRDAKMRLFNQRARDWADWWEEHAHDFKVPPEYRSANLPSKNDVQIAPELRPNARYRTVNAGSNWILESVKNPAARRVFFDLDTSRVAALPEQFRAQLLEDTLDVNIPGWEEIAEWAASEGFDIMGTELPINDNESIYALRLIGARAWELDKSRWKMTSNRITLEELLKEGTPVQDYLFHQDPETEERDYRETGTFLVVTREGTPALVFLGIEVRDDSLKPGGIAQGDDELNPVAFYQGRRFAFTFFEELPE